MFKHLQILLLVLTIGFSYKVSDFKPQIFSSSPPSGFYAVNTGNNIEG